MKKTDDAEFPYEALIGGSICGVALAAGQNVAAALVALVVLVVIACRSFKPILGARNKPQKGSGD